MPPSRRCVVFSRRYGRAEKLRVTCAILISEELFVFGHFHCALAGARQSGQEVGACWGVKSDRIETPY